MAEPTIFGSREPGVQYTPRRAAYVVIYNDGGEVATVVGPGQKQFLPGGGSQPGESPEETCKREVSEELGRGVRLTRRLGEALQYFYSEMDERHYEMRATFFAGEFTDEVSGDGGHELRWLPPAWAEESFFHACHAWAARRG
ncbi:MAG: NUDIX domain-containing protein [Acidobacteriota bacterium]|nr:NUDIX domain-containing protein [Acidobacteriota bacterium]MDQ5836898.1 NUDIX domain-containing protein [Acidobacteriota bacterium]